MGLGGNEAGAHGDHAGRVSELGEARTALNQWRPSAAVEDEDDGVEAMQSFPRGLAWWGGRGGRGGAPELSGGAKGGWWPRWLRARSAAVLGHGGEAEERGGGRSRERGRSERGSRGVRGTLGCLQRRAGKQEVAGALGRAPPSSFGARGRKTTGGEVAVVGWAALEELGQAGKSGKWLGFSPF